MSSAPIRGVDAMRRAAGRRCGLPVALALALAGLPACSREPAPVAITPIRFDRGGLSVSLAPSVSLRRIDVLDDAEVLRYSSPWPDGPANRVSLPFAWQSDRAYTVRLFDRNGRAWQRTDRAPGPPAEPFSMEFALPHGAGDGFARSAARTFAVGTRTEATLRVESNRAGPMDVALTVGPGEALEETTGGGAVRFDVRLKGRGDVWFGQVTVRVGAAPIRLVAEAKAADGSGEQVLERSILPADPASLAGDAVVVGLELPALPSGAPDPRWQPDAVQLPGRFAADLLRRLGVQGRPADPYEPYTWQAVTVRNRGDTVVPLLFRARVLDERTGEPVPALSAPAAASAGTGESLQIAECLPGRDTRVALPVYVHAGMAEEGRYRREVRACVLGTDYTVFSAQRPLEVRRTGTTAWAAAGFACLATLAGMFLLARAGARFWSAFRVRELIVIALYGSVSFAAVAVPGSLLASVLSAVLGPLSAVVTGLVGRVLGYLVLASMLRMVPRPGAATLATAVKWLLSAVLFGQLSATAFLYLGTYSVLLEGACRAGGITRWGRENWLTGARAWRAAAWVAAADAAATFVDFEVTALLYRVYFADWYVWLTVWLNGFLYTLAGTLLGFRLGREMQRVA